MEEAADVVCQHLRVACVTIRRRLRRWCGGCFGTRGRNHVCVVTAEHPPHPSSLPPYRYADARTCI